LAYAESHPERVTELVLRGIFMLRRWELEWFYQEGASRLFPDAWEPYLQAIPEAERGDLIGAYHRRLTSPDEATRLAAARTWSVWEGATSFLRVDPAFVIGHEDAAFALAFARIENHYFVNGGFFDDENQLLRDVARIADIPGVIVHGRYDVVCPIQSAWELHKAWPKAELMISPTSGHSAFEPENVDALVRATDSFAAG
jgi:proline iminopeptidase